MKTAILCACCLAVLGTTAISQGPGTPSRQIAPPRPDAPWVLRAATLTQPAGGVQTLATLWHPPFPGRPQGVCYVVLADPLLGQTMAEAPPALCYRTVP